MNQPGSPMPTGHERDSAACNFEGDPVRRFKDRPEAKVRHEVRHSRRYDDRLSCGDFAEGPAVEMVKVGVRYEDEVDGAEVRDGNPRVADSLQAFDPFCPDWVD